MSQFIAWSDEISVGIQEIDEQHKQLVNLLNSLFDAMVNNAEDRAQVTRKILAELFRYTSVHFAVEESLFRIFNYPDYENHKKNHDKLKAQVREIYLQVQSGEKRIDSKLLVFLRNWLTSHIMEEDKAYAGFLINQGVKKSWVKKSWLGKLLG